MGDARLVVPADCILHGIFVPKLDESNCFLLSVVVIDWNFDTDYLHEKMRLVNPQETYGGGVTTHIRTSRSEECLDLVLGNGHRQLINEESPWVSF